MFVHVNIVLYNMIYMRHILKITIYNQWDIVDALYYIWLYEESFAFLEDFEFHHEPRKRKDVKKENEKVCGGSVIIATLANNIRLNVTASILPCI